jgi:predicted transcriptional regulator of viral defense system
MANLKPIRSSKWEQFFVELQSQGRYNFTFEELGNRFKLSEKTLLQGLYRYKNKKQIAQIRKGFYVIIPPNYSNQGMLPPYLFIDDLMKSLNKQYYVALISAAALHGAAHQQPMEYFVIAETPAPRSINNKKLKVLFFSKNTWELQDIQQKASDAGYFNVSSPELTALDLLAYVDKIGMNRTITVLQELVQAMKVATLSKTAKRYLNTPVIQRLGYILEKVLSEEKLADTLLKTLKSRNISPVLLVTQKEKHGALVEPWKVIENMRIESDL